ncbi:MAG: hypothetical protein KDJ50_07775 [Alphaproteobacteria bacterium]|nr:hypothetical protein [Alphaproteobacteria bacterium]
MTELEMKKLDRMHSALMVFTTVAGGFAGAVIATALKDNPLKWVSVCAPISGMAYSVVACAISPKFKASLAGESFASSIAEEDSEELTVAVQPQEEKVTIRESHHIPA